MMNIFKKLNKKSSILKEKLLSGVSTIISSHLVSLMKLCMCSACKMPQSNKGEGNLVVFAGPSELGLH